MNYFHSPWNGQISYHNVNLESTDAAEELIHLWLLKTIVQKRLLKDLDREDADLPLVTFKNTANPYDDPASPDDEVGFHFQPASAPEHDQELQWRQSAAHGLEALSAAAAGDHYVHLSHDRDADFARIRPNTAPFLFSPPATRIPTTQTHNLNSILNAPDVTPQTLDPRLYSPRSSEASPNVHPRTTPSELVSNSIHTDENSMPVLGEYSELDHEVAFLLRHFSENAGSWMDLFDLDSYFAHTVPVHAKSCDLLRHAAVALAAKSIARLQGRHVLNNEPRRARMQHLDGCEHQDWYRKATQYYDDAIGSLRAALSASVSDTELAEETQTSHRVPDAQHIPSDVPYNNARVGPTRAVPKSLPSPESDELLASIAILCVYEFLDASGAEWSRHLDGAKSLFQIAKDRMMPLQAEVASPHISEGRRAVFWNFARQDMLSAFINHTCTRLDTADIPMWRSAGLHISDSGFIVPSNTSANLPMKDDMISNALVWLLCKLVNFMAAGDDLPAEINPWGYGITQQQLLDYWQQLDEQLTVWYEGLPASFMPSAILQPQTNLDANLVRVKQTAEAWYARPMCASTMQSYHFARIQLLHNKPHLTTQSPPRATSRHPQTPRPLSSPSGQGTPSPASSHTRRLIRTPKTSNISTRHASYRAIVKQSEIHAREIVSIALGRSDAGVRVHAVQPLYAAGQVLGSAGESSKDDVDAARRCVVDLLREIEADTGWACEYRVQQLLEEWECTVGW
ncbi:FACT complex subunit [Elasticomyces elasticus]|nr:FACT complex subunit [Elasticomyces elasticus]